MNIHPMFVHLPIGILILYALCELIPRRFTDRFTWFEQMKAFLSWAGVIAAFATLITGGLAEDMIPAGDARHLIIAVHEPFAWATFTVFALLAIGYWVRAADKLGWGERFISWGSWYAFSWRLKQRVWGFVLSTPIRQILAFAGLILITITGGLGAAIVYGPDFDPAVHFIYHLFF